MAANTQTPIVLLAITGAFEAKEGELAAGTWDNKRASLAHFVSKGREMAELRQQSWDMLSAQLKD